MHESTEVQQIWAGKDVKTKGEKREKEGKYNYHVNDVRFNIREARL